MSGKDIAPIEEISLSAELTDRGVKAGAKSRALVAVDRLLGSTIDLVGVPIEGLRDRMRARNEVREKLIEAHGKERLQQLHNDSASEAAVLETLVLSEHGKAANKEAVAIEFIEQLRAEPEPEVDTSEPLDPDWMNMFASHAENASSDRLRSLWASILAGQVRKPGAFSLSTLRFISELDQSIAELFQRYLGSVVFGQFLLKPKDLKGQTLIDLTFLEEVGLLSEVNGMLGIPIKNASDGYWYETSGNLLLRLKLSGEVRVELIKLTRVGQEISNILPKKDDQVALVDMFEQVKDSVQEADLNLIVARNADGTVNHVPMRKLK